MSRRTISPTEDFRRDSDRALLALAAAGVGEFEWDIPGDELIISPRMAALTGMRTGARPARGGAALLDHVHPDDAGELRQAIDDGLRLSDRYDIQFRFLRPEDQRQIWLNSRAVAVRGEQGELIGTIGVVRDVSSEKGEADQRNALVAELDHRVKNVLASVQSLAAQSARRTVSLEAFLKTFFGRLEAMAAAHTLLTATRWRGAEISQIAAAELGGLGFGQAHWQGPDIVLSPRATHALTLALHELSANAVKHGALSSESGHIDVKWRHNAQGGFDLLWIEKGGPPVTPPVRRGFGSTLLERVTGRELGGSATFDFRPDGLRVSLVADSTALASATPHPTVAPAVNEPGSTPTLEDTPAPTGASSGGVAQRDVRGTRVLIVEDAVLLALELESGLVESGAVVVGLAADLDEALGMLSLDFDVAVLDANLNGRSVMPMAHALVERHVPFIFATGYGDAGAAPSGFSVPVVRKPYNVREIAAALVDAMAVDGSSGSA
jgi:two-component sensor histidine kinase